MGRGNQGKKESGLQSQVLAFPTHSHPGMKLLSTRSYNLGLQVIKKALFVKVGG